MQLNNSVLEINWKNTFFILKITPFMSELRGKERGFFVDLVFLFFFSF